MCDEYDDEMMQVFWRTLERSGDRKQVSPKPEETAVPLLPLGSASDPPRIPKPRALTR